MDKTRRIFCQSLSIAAVAALPAAALGAEPDAGSSMPLFTAIETRRSIRAYNEDPVSDEDLQKMLQAAMAAPSAANEQPWEFVIVKDKALLQEVGNINHYATYAAKAPVAVLVCLNEEKEKIKGMGIIDVSMSSENLLLAAVALGLGAVFTGIYPFEDRMQKFKELFNLPDKVLPIGLIVLGHPLHPQVKTHPERFNPKAIHYDKWQDAAKG